MRILALDIGSYSIKAVVLDVTFGRVELADYFIERVVESRMTEVQESEASEQNSKRKILSDGQAAAIRRLITEHELRFDRLSVNLPKAWVTTRIFDFPTKDRKAIQSSLTFELDDDIPFPMGDIVHDFAISSSEGSHSSVFAALALKSDLSDLISELQTSALDPDIITIECWGMGYLLKRALPKQYEGKPVCIVNMGSKQTSIHMFIGDNPVLSHVCTCAGADVTAAIAQAYNLGYDQAEKSKIDGSFLLTEMHLSGEAGDEPLTDEQKQFSATIADAFLPMLREIKQTLMAYKSQFKTNPRAIFITGGTSLIPNMPLFLEEILKIPVFPLTYMSKVVGQTLQLAETTEAAIAAGTALALSAAKTDRNSSINLRKDEFAKKTGLGAVNWKAYRRPLKYVAFSLAFVYFNLIAQWIILNHRAASQDKEFSLAIKSVVGAISPSVMDTYKESPSILKDAVKRELSKYELAHAVPIPKHSVSALDVLNTVSRAIPKDMTLDVSDFNIKDGKLRLAGKVDSLANSDRIVQALKNSHIVTDLKKTKDELNPKTKKVDFDFSAKLAEISNGKTK